MCVWKQYIRGQITYAHVYYKDGEPGQGIERRENERAEEEESERDRKNWVRKCSQIASD